MNTADTAAATTYTKAMSNSGTLHWMINETGQAACATGKVKPAVTPLSPDEQGRPITCKRCERLTAGITAAQAQDSVDDIDALLDEVAGINELGSALADAIRQEQAAGNITDDEARSLAETAPEAALEAHDAAWADGEALVDTIDEATASDTEAAEEAAERDAAEAAPAPPAAPAQRKARTDQAALVKAYLEANPGKPFTPHQISKAVTPQGAKALGLRDVCARLAAKGEIELVEGTKAATYRLPAPQAAPAEAAAE